MGGSPTLRRFAAWATRPAIHYTGRVSGSRWPIGWIFALVIGLIAWVVFSKWQESDSGSAAPPPAAVADHANHADHDDHSAHAGHATLAAVAPIISTTFDASGVLYAAEAKDDRVLVTISRDAGRTFDAPVVLTPEAESLDANGEARPKIAIGPGGEVLVSWTQRGSAPYTGNIRFARSTDGGRTFSAPVTVNDDGLPIGHRFDALGVAPDGTVVLAWIDKRDLEAATLAGETYAGAAVYFATSRDGGATFSVNRKAKDNVCECCRLGLAFEADSTPVLLWRDVLPGGIRDHVMMRVTADGSTAPVHRVSHENWAIDACPHHGPALVIAPSSQRHHFAWFTGAESTGNAVFYAHTDDGGRTTSPPMRVGKGEFVGHPSLAIADGRLWLAWKEWRDDNTTEVFAMRSDDDGATWSTARRVAVAPGNSDRPYLLASGADVYLSWTDTTGLRIVRITQ